VIDDARNALGSKKLRGDPPGIVTLAPAPTPCTRRHSRSEHRQRPRLAGRRQLADRRQIHAANNAYNEKTFPSGMRRFYASAMWIMAWETSTRLSSPH
jgi:hypothetical protein